jgi:type I restriction enzyme S subunit
MNDIEDRECGGAGEDQGVGMKEGWQTQTLGEVCEFSNGLWKGQKPPFITVGVIRNTNFTKEGALDDSDIAYIDVEAKKLGKRRLKFGDIILEKSGGGPKQPVGRVVLFDKKDGDFSFSNFTAALRVRDPEAIDFRYLHKFLHWTYLSGVTERIQSHSTGIRNLNGDAYKAIKFSFPPLPEQQRIVALLDEAFAGLATAKASAERNLQNARAIFESHLQSVFSQRGEGWVEKRLADLSDFKNGLNFTRQSNGQTLRMVGVGDFQANSVVPIKSLQSVTIDGVVSEEYLIRQGDILTVRSNGSKDLVGRCMLVPDVDGMSSFSGFIIRIRLRTGDVDPRFLLHFMRSRTTRERLAGDGGGSNISNINQAKLSELPISYPSLCLQEKIISSLVALSEETQHLTHLYERKLAALEELKKSLLHQAFNGEL